MKKQKWIKTDLDRYLEQEQKRLDAIPKKVKKYKEYEGFKEMSQIWGFPHENSIETNKGLVKHFEFEIEQKIEDWGAKSYLKKLKKELQKQLTQLN